VTVRVEPPTERTPVPLSGTFFVPPAWKKSRFILQFEPIDVLGKTPDMQRSLSRSNMTRDPATPSFHHWDAGLVVPGRYGVKCPTLAMQWVVDTGPNGNRNVEIVVGPPVDVSVQVIEDGTGRSVEKTNVFWNASRPEGVSGGSLGRARWNRTKKRHEFRAAAGKIEVQVLNREYTTTSDRVFDVHPNNKDIVIRVRRASGIVLFLKHGETAIPWDESTRNELAIEKVDGTCGKVGSGGSDEHGKYLKVAVQRAVPASRALKHPPAPPGTHPTTSPRSQLPVKPPPSPSGAACGS